MVRTSVVAFRTPVVHEMTLDEYREQRRRVIAALTIGRDGARAVPPQAPRTVKS
jgi:hypothetical protein